METRKHIEVVAAVIEAEGQVLCTQRGPSGPPYISGKWEFPGGKIEAGEAREAALVREISEELAVAIRVGVPLLRVDHAYLDFSLTMHVFRCELLDGVEAIHLAEHVAAVWLSPADVAFGDLDWAAADVPIAQKLRQERNRLGGVA